MSKILLTGGAGYIGSHTAIEMLNAGYEIIVADNFSNSSKESLRRVEKITGKTIPFYQADITDKEQTEKIFEENCRRHSLCRSEIGRRIGFLSGSVL